MFVGKQRLGDCDGIEQVKPEDVDAYAQFEIDRAREGFYQGMVERLPVVLEGACVLDLAAGPGTWSRLFAIAGASLVIWHDRSAKFLSIAQRHLQEVDEASFVVADLARLPYRGSTFDLVFCRVSLHHSPAQASTVREIARVLRPGGAAVLITHRLARVTRRIPRGWKKPLHYVTPVLNIIAGRKVASAVWTIDWILRRQLQRAGLVIEEWDSTDPESLIAFARKPCKPMSSSRSDG